MSNQQSWDRRSSTTSPPGQQTLPSINTFSSIPSVNPSNGHSPPLSNPPTTDISRDSGNWSMNSARQSNISDSTSFANMTLPPIDQATATRHSPPDQTFPHSHSPVASSFAASQTSLHATPPAHQYAQHGHDQLPSPSPSTSRRSSFDSRLGNLNLSSPINGNTPAASQVSLNSTLYNKESSLATGLARDRGILTNSPHPQRMEQNGHDPANPHMSISNPFGTGNRTSTAPARTAPPIMGQPQRFPYGQGPHPNAPSPTKGFPYAFPDPDIAQEPGRSSQEGSMPGSGASSMFSTNSGLVPHHQMNMGMNGITPMGQPAHHHHGLQQRRPSLGDSTTPYSRTPELRVSHKLAERKRRKEMKELFDELRDALPAERGGKSSKWEVLTKAIEHVKEQKTTIDKHGFEIERLRAESDQRQNEMNALRAELQNMRQQMGSYAHAPTHHPSGNQYQVPHMNGGYRPPTAQSGNGGGYHHHNDSAGKMQGLEQC